MKISKFQTDPELETKGVTVAIGDGATVTVARIGNPRYRERFNALMRPHRHAQARGVLDEDVTTKIIVEAMADAVLLGWAGLTEDDGSAITYSRENALRLLGIKDFRETVIEIATSMEAFRAQGSEAAQGN